MLSRVAYAALILNVVFVSLVVLHKSVRALDIVPYLEVDDSIPNVAVTLAEHGRYGFLSMPTQGTREVDQTHAFYNYGPLYFYVASAVVWLAGPSLLLFRLFHPAGLIVIVALWLWTFRRVGVAGVAAFAIPLFSIYLSVHSPIARPDIAVSLCVAPMLLCMAGAIAERRTSLWWAAGFFAGGAATSHLVASGVVVAAALVWLWSALVALREPDRPSKASLLRSLAALVGGGVAAGLVFLMAIDFRVRDLLDMTGGLATQFRRPFVEMFAAHVSRAWATGNDDEISRLVVAAFIGAACLVFAGPFLPPLRRRQVTAFVMPPVLTVVVHQLTVGLYGNNATGYAVVSHVATLWAIAAAVAVAIAWACDALPRARPYGDVLVLVVAGILIANRAISWAGSRPGWERDIPGHVHISDYIRQVLAPLPERAVVWGSLYFGVDAGVRTELVEFQHGLTPALDFKPERRERIVPDFLALSLYIFQYAVPQMLLNQDNTLGTFFQIFPDARYRELKLVYAPPYGAAMVYERVGNGETLQEPVPAVAINDGSSRQWSTRTSDPLPVVFRPARPVTARIRHYTYDVSRAAQATVAADLEPGFYLIDVEVERVPAEQNGFFLASGDLQYDWRSADATPLAMTPYFVGSSHAWTVVDHPGGPLYLSRFERAPMTSGATGTGSGLSVRSIRRVVPLVAPTHIRETVHLPPLSKWRMREGIIESDGAGGYRVIGPEEEPVRLLETAVINLGPNRLATLLTANLQGGASITVTDRNGFPIARPVRMPGRVTFESPPDGAVKFVLTGAGELPAGEAGTVVPLGPALLYMDRVMTCRSPYITVNEDACVNPR